jgi:MoaA/NifB/PqqE/SkfB family radical SAM enzyme
MSKLFETARVLHIEPTDVCQAACPLCARETDPTFNKELKHSYSLQDFKELVPEKLIYRLDKVFMCGNYGDPAANSASKSILSYVREVNSSIVLGMNTNGGLQDTMWWADLANVMHQPRDYVVFSIDGLEDTNHIYRKNVSWDRVMRNAETFISSGGNAQWDMLIYEHNEHQVDACEQLAQTMGFKWFRAKVSKRESTVDWLQPPKGWTRPVIDHGPINCFRNQDQSIYLNAKGVFQPCCWLGYTDATVDDFNSISQTWDTDQCNPICKSTCSTVNNMSNFTGQWQREVQLC